MLCGKLVVPQWRHRCFIRPLSTQTQPLTIQNKRILRDFISEHLFSTHESYFTNQAPVHSSAELKFTEMWGENDYRVI